MVSKGELNRYIKQHLSESRYEHTMGVAKVAKELAEINHVSPEKAEIAALCHDIAKNLTIDQMKKIIKDQKIELSDDEKTSIEVWHAILAPVLAREDLEVYDVEILQSIRWHTTGKENMSILDKIIYIADMIEPRREFKGVDEIREEAYKNLDKGVVMGIDHTIEYLVQRKSPIDVNSVKARNYIIKQYKKGKLRANKQV